MTHCKLSLCTMTTFIACMEEEAQLIVLIIDNAYYQIVVHFG